MKPDISILLVTYNCRALLERLSLSLAAVHDVTFEVLVVDNASRDGSADWIAAHQPGWRLVRNAVNVGFGRANNQLLPLVQGRHVLLLNTDAFIAPDTLQKTLQQMDATPDLGVLGVQLIGDDGVAQPSARFFPTPLSIFLQRSGLQRHVGGVQAIDLPEWRLPALTECDWVPGCYYLVRGEAIQRLGLFDPRFFLYYEEVDHCRRVKAAGFRVQCLPSTEVVHLGGGSAASDGVLTAGARQLMNLATESELLYLRKHFGVAGLGLHLLLESLLRIKEGLVHGARASAQAAPAWAALRQLWRSLQLTRLGRVATR